MSRRILWRAFRREGLFAALKCARNLQLLADIRKVNRLLDAKLREARP